MTPRARTLAIAFLTSSLLAAQNEIVFGSGGGATGPYTFAASASGTIASAGTSTLAANITDAVWMDFGTNLYCAKTGPAGNYLSRAQWNGTSPNWSNFGTAPGLCYGIAGDRARKRLWVLTGLTGTTRELHCYDADNASATYGQVITQTTTLSGASRERWELSPSGNLAAVPHAFLHGAGLFQIVDTNPTSATFLQVLQSTAVPNAVPPASIAAACSISGDDLFACAVYTGINAASQVYQQLVVMFIPTGALLDFDPSTPGQQDFPIPLAVPNRMAMSAYGYRLCISGQGGTGWAARVDLDPFTPQNTTFTQLLPGPVLTSCNGASLSADGRRLAVTKATPAALVLIDVQTGALLHSIAIASNGSTTAWQDLRPDASFTSYGTGCGGSLGLPTLTAAAGPRLGTTFSMTAGNAPGSLALFVAGTSDTFSGSTPLPYSLTPHGAAGCFLLTEAGITIFQTGSGNSVSWSFGVPNDPAHLGFVLYSQAFTLDPSANLLGIGTTPGGRALVGL